MALLLSVALEFIFSTTSCPGPTSSLGPAHGSSSLRVASRSTTQEAVSRASGSWSQHSVNVEQKTLIPCRLDREHMRLRWSRSTRTLRRSQSHQVFHLMLRPGCRKVGPPSVPQNKVSHGVHTGLVAHLGTKDWHVAPHLLGDRTGSNPKGRSGKDNGREHWDHERR